MAVALKMGGAASTRATSSFLAKSSQAARKLQGDAGVRQHNGPCFFFVVVLLKARHSHLKEQNPPKSWSLWAKNQQLGFAQINWSAADEDAMALNAKSKKARRWK